ncbi:MAG: HAMP domain-containing sensor histidine kinase [Chryseolinea sp.]
MRNMFMEVTDNSGSTNKDPIHQDLYSITHDLRAPLMSIKGLISLLKSETNKENIDQYISFLEASVDKMNETISGIIDSSKGSESNEIQKLEIDFRKIIAESLHSLQFMEDMDRVHITISAEESGLFLSDYNRILSIFNNMISNAVRYRDCNKNSFLHIDVSIRKGVATLVFTDNGIGIDNAFQSKIFDKLFRISNDQRGSGLGLHIVQKSIVKLNGTIKLHSILGEGTTFTIEIPNLLSNMSIHCD